MRTKSYALANGVVLHGEQAKICHFLDNAGIRDASETTMTEAETLHEVVAYLKDWSWCAHNSTVVIPAFRDHYSEEDYGVLETAILEFCTARNLWASSEFLINAEDKAEAKWWKAYSAFCRKACNRAHISNVAALFKSMRAIGPGELNQTPTAIGTPLGVVDLDQGMLLADDISYEGSAAIAESKTWRITKTTRGNVVCNETADELLDPRWEEFILEIMNGDAEKAAYLKRALGYTMLGGNPEECMFIAYGAAARNGKGTLLESVAWALGDYAKTADKNYLMEGFEADSGEQTAALESARMVVLSEPSKQRYLDEAKLKSITGGDTISTRHIYGRQFEFKPQFTIWLACNNLPRVRDTTVFTSGRLRVIPFERHFEKSERDITLKDRFRSARGMLTIMNWLVEGYLEWRDIGLAEPASIKEATARYGEASGPSFERFLTRCCEVKMSERVLRKDLTDAYQNFCIATDLAPQSNSAITAELEQRGVVTKKSGGYRYLVGVTLNKYGRKFTPKTKGRNTPQCPLSDPNRVPPSAENVAKIKLV